jgi:hypothetical protein
MQVGNNLGFSGNYCFIFKDNTDKYKAVNAIESNANALKKQDCAGYQLTSDNTEKNKSNLWIETDYNQFSRKDRTILNIIAENYGCFDSKGSRQKQTDEDYQVSAGLQGLINNKFKESQTRFDTTA